MRALALFKAIRLILSAILLTVFGNSPVAWADQVTYIHTDVLGSPVAGTNSSGELLWQEYYAPYGDRERIQGDGDNAVWYAGKVQDSASLLVNMGARQYNPLLGRFMSTDPAAVNPADWRTFNRYSYGNNNPYKFVDPSGGVAETPWDVANVAMGVASFAVNVTAGNYVGAAVDAGGVVLDTIATVTPGVPGGAGTAIKLGRAADTAADLLKRVEVTAPYKRPSGATTSAQRASVQDKPCVKCGVQTPKQVAGHKNALVKEYYETGSIDKERMRSLDAVRSECPTCSAREGADMSRYSREMKKDLGQ